MFKKTVTAAVAALTLAGATVAVPSAAEARGLGRAVAIGALGFAVGAAAASSYAYARPVYYGGCGFVRQPIVNPWGEVVGFRRIPAC
jgi:predicted N-acetyltransferase YhbS